MAFQHTPYTIPLLLGAGVHLLLLGYLLAYRSVYRRVPGSWTASLLLIASMVWMLAYAFELASVGLVTKLFWNKAQYFGSAGLPALLFVYVLQYTGNERYVTRGTIAGLTTIPVATVLLTVTNEAHGLIWRRVHLDVAGSYTVLINEHGPAFWVFIAYAYALMLVALGLLGLHFARSRGFYRRQTSGLLVGVTVPLVGSVLYASGLNPMAHLNLPVLAFVATSLTVGWSVFRHQLFSVTPIARDTVVEEMDAAVLVIDDRDRVVDANDAARALVGRETPVGEPIEVVWPGHTHRLADERSWAYREKVTVHSPDGRRYYDLQVTPLSNDDGQQVGRLLVARDVTGRERRERELQRKNEQLEEFAGVLSHDLRNPLSVARGYLELAEEDGDETTFRRVEQAHDRIERIIEDMLTLARQGQTVSETSSVELADVAADAWANVTTPDADLVVVESCRLEADETRLLQLFENLFSNSVEHVPGHVEIRVGTTADVPGEQSEPEARQTAESDGGFYVADDGPGIPESDRADVFAYGHSSEEDGTGLGLSIVKSVAEAHGWEVAVDDSWAGGARFEFAVR